MRTLLLKAKDWIDKGGAIRSTVHGGPNVVCPKGHYNVSVTRFYDETKKCLCVEAKCLEPGCDESAKIYDSEEHDGSAG